MHGRHPPVGATIRAYLPDVAQEVCKGRAVGKNAVVPVAGRPPPGADPFDCPPISRLPPKATTTPHQVAGPTEPKGADNRDLMGPNGPAGLTC